MADWPDRLCRRPTGLERSRNALPGDGAFGTDDITLCFDGSGKDMYAGYLLGTTVALNVDRTANPTSGSMAVLEGRPGVDQPFTEPPL
jgi:hypothetical protein